MRKNESVGLRENREKISSFRSVFPELERVHQDLMETLPSLLTKLYSDCQSFAETEIKSLLEKFERAASARA